MAWLPAFEAALFLRASGPCAALTPLWFFSGSELRSGHAWGGCAGGLLAVLLLLGLESVTRDMSSSISSCEQREG